MGPRHKDGAFAPAGSQYWHHCYLPCPLAKPAVRRLSRALALTRFSYLLEHDDTGMGCYLERQPNLSATRATGCWRAVTTLPSTILTMRVATRYTSTWLGAARTIVIPR